jgi:hypothetical protein
MKKLISFALLCVLPVFAAPKTELFRGKILSVEEDYCSKSVDYILRATLASENQDTLTLALAPKWYLHSRQIEIRIGADAEVRAFKDHDGIYHVTNIKLGKKLYVLRDKNGKPAWKAQPGSEDLFKNICKA